MKSLREIFRIKPKGAHRRTCRCADIPEYTPALGAGTKWKCPTCKQKYVVEIVRGPNGRYALWLETKW